MAASSACMVALGFIQMEYKWGTHISTIKLTITARNTDISGINRAGDDGLEISCQVGKCLRETDFQSLYVSAHTKIDILMATCAQ